jgi:hypothetical protein
MRTHLKEREEAVLLDKLHDARRLENAEKEQTTFGQVIQELRQKVDTASREADEQAVKQRRATLQLQKVIREVMEKIDIESLRNIEKELLLV